MYQLYLNSNPPLIIIPIIIILLLHFLSLRYIPTQKQQLLNYAPIWSSASVLAFIFIYLSDTFLIGEKITRVIAVISLGVLYLITMGMAEKMVEEE